MFDLEKKIKNWKQSLRKNREYEDGDIEELESHLRDRIDELIESGASENEAFQNASSEIGDVKKVATEFYKTSTTKPYLDNSSGINLGILNNFIKISRRNLLRNKLYTSLNILGLVIGITSALFIYLFIQNELSYDTFHEKGDRIYKVHRMMERPEGTELVGITSNPFRAGLEAEFPDMIEMAATLGPGDGVVSIDDQNFMESRLYMADKNFFQVFTYPFIAGNPETALVEPYTVVLSKETAQKYFGTENPIGKNIIIDGEDSFEVTGVFEVPEGAKSHVNFDLAVSIITFSDYNFYNQWGWNQVHTYALLSEGVELADIEPQLPAFMDKYFGDNMAEMNRRIDLNLMPLDEVYFSNFLAFDWQVEHGDKKVIYIFGIIAILIIVVAGVNFINLATARSVSRAKEVGVRKTLGAQRLILFAQFMSEAFLMAFFAGFISFILVYFFLPPFEQMIGTSISINLFSTEIILMTISILLLTGFLAGVYPAIFLSSFKPIKALKEKISFGTSQLVTRKGLIIFQFAISSLLIIGVSIVNKQLDYISDKSLGFQPDQLLDISVNNSTARNNLPQMLEQLKGIPGVEEASVMSGSPGGFFDTYSFNVESYENPLTMNTLFIDDSFSEVFDLEMVVGRDFDKAYSTDSASAIIINERAVEFLGWTISEAVGKQIGNAYRDEVPRTVIGVVEDFHFASLHHQIDPLVVSMTRDYRNIVLKISTENISGLLPQITEIWNNFSPLYPIEYRFVNEQFAQLYESDTRQRKVFFAFSIIAIVIACLGLFGLATFNAEKRSKEMGIRKILGATMSDLLLVFNKEVLIIIGISFLIAAPVTYFLAEEWLQNYAYRINNEMNSYIIAGIVVMLLAIITVSYQTVKVAWSNPVDSLKDE
ncbi:MAG: ABC transporter permease [Balneolaceae bacterium]|nr:ABC transporter permease [Balneolaceae bacterium]MBO6546027.1 ABC transporter permease [Balneolaceae bacterium]MBO6647423.1 ABC transporter permease [Balneolaceae bacterium]